MYGANVNLFFEGSFLYQYTFKTTAASDVLWGVPVSVIWHCIIYVKGAGAWFGIIVNNRV
jgi:hypothetical protein